MSPLGSLKWNLTHKPRLKCRYFPPLQSTKETQRFKATESVRRFEEG
jgi:hypothetical protein